MPEKQKKARKIKLPGGTKMWFQHIPACPGGARLGQRGGRDNEQPVHKVSLKEFYLGRYPVTQEQFDEWRKTSDYDQWFALNRETIKETSLFDEDTPHENHFKERPNHPAEEVTWWEARRFAEWLTEQKAHYRLLEKRGIPQAEWKRWRFDLPTEVQWEYACRAGSRSDYFNGDGIAALEKVGWFHENSERTTHPVKDPQKESNLFGLSHPHGNVWEWCRDSWAADSYRTRLLDSNAVVGREEGADRVLRGGSCINTAAFCRSAFRGRGQPGFRFWGVGFRLALVPGPSRQEEAGGREPEAQAAGAGKPTTEEASVPETAAGAEVVDLSAATFRPPQADDEISLKSQDMSTDKNDNFIALSSLDGQVWECSNPGFKKWPEEPGERARVQKVVLGRLDGEKDDDKWTSIVEELQGHDLSEWFPNLTCLHLWGLKDLKTLPQLPEGLTDLDIQNCPNFKNLTHLPGKELEILVFKDCPKLDELPEVPDLSKLEEIELQGSAEISNDWINQAVASTGEELWQLILNRCRLLTGLNEWPGKLEDARFNECPELRTLPGYCPPSLRRLEIKNTKLKRLPGNPIALDYVNLCYARQLSSLRELCRQKTFPRTLYLHGCGLTQPPAFQHGESEDTNVAVETELYFKDTDLVGEGAVNQCKLLFLGNGTAGKTCLSLALQPTEICPDPGAAATALDTTHGIQFRRHHEMVTTEKGNTSIGINHWDFGGQEIYHSTHRLFMGAGSIFVILWDPSQDGRQPRRLKDSKYEDRWYRLRYWLDMAAQAGIGSQEIVVVCPRRKERDKNLETKFKQECGQGYPDLDLFIVDSATRDGEFAELKTWLNQAVGRVIERDGTIVPAYWEIALELMETKAEERLRQEKLDQSQKQITLGELGDELSARIDQAISGPQKQRYYLLAQAIEHGEFSIDEKRTKQLAAVLTHIGAVFWRPDLFEERVIVDQRWALDGIYSVLSRDSAIFDWLIENGGQFTRSDLAELCWREVDPEDQKLLLSFMEECQVCFQLLDGKESIFRERLYLSLKHLPEEREVDLQGEFDQSSILLSDFTAVVTPEWQPWKWLHRAHWQGVLCALGSVYGKHARYAKDAFYLPLRPNHSGAIIKVQFDPTGVGGQIYCETVGVKSDELSQQLATIFNTRIPQNAAGVIVGSMNKTCEVTLPPDKRKQLFISYARSPKGGDPLYSEVVDALVGALKPYEEHLEVLRDKEGIKKRQSVRFFIDDAKRADRVLIVHSDKYWEGPYCLFEVFQSLEYATYGMNKAPKDVFLLLEIPSLTEKKDGDYLSFWADYDVKEYSDVLKTVILADSFKTKAENFFRSEKANLFSGDGVRENWSPERLNDLVKWILEDLGMAPK